MNDAQTTIAWAWADSGLDQPGPTRPMPMELLTYGRILPDHVYAVTVRRRDQMALGSEFDSVWDVNVRFLHKA